MLEESGEERQTLCQIAGSHLFPAAVHGELGHARVATPDSGLLCDDGSDCAPAGAVVSHDEFLNFATNLKREVRRRSTASEVRGSYAIALDLLNYEAPRRFAPRIIGSLSDE